VAEDDPEADVGVELVNGHEATLGGGEGIRTHILAGTATVEGLLALGVRLGATLPNVPDQVMET
jgi:hypothetical protein